MKHAVYLLTSFMVLSTISGCGPATRLSQPSKPPSSQTSASNMTEADTAPSSASGKDQNTPKTDKQKAMAVRKASIKLVQKRLNALGFTVGTPDGLFGQKTLLGVKAFQKKHHLSIDGVIGKNTWTALFAGVLSEPAYPGQILKAPQSVVQALQTVEEETQSSSDSSKDGTSKGHYVNWRKPTGGAYPDLSKYKDIWIDVSLSKQRTYIKAGNRTIYTMVVSTGLNTPGRRTPTGTYHIQAERGKWFYEPRFSEGAEYWVSFLNHGQYLFHTVPMNRNKQVIVPVAEKLGHPASHGCVHLSLADAKWFYYHIKTGTKVVIQK